MPNKGKAFTGPVWGQDVVPLAPAAIISLRDNVVRRLKGDAKYGGYDAIQYMMGSSTADQLSENGYLTRRSEGMAEPSGSGREGSSSKRGQREWEQDVPEVQYVSADALRGGHNRKVSRAY